MDNVNAKLMWHDVLVLSTITLMVIAYAVGLSVARGNLSPSFSIPSFSIHHFRRLAD
jgi:hypothetical protein